MSKRLLHHIRGSAIGYTALFFALGGVSYARTLAPPNAVNSHAIIDGQVTTPGLAVSYFPLKRSASLVRSRKFRGNLGWLPDDGDNRPA